MRLTRAQLIGKIGYLSRELRELQRQLRIANLQWESARRQLDAHSHLIYEPPPLPDHEAPASAFR
jgi:chemotaxis regulatin CheY-phosphate phosphatase CheZ